MKAPSFQPVRTVSTVAMAGFWGLLAFACAGRMRPCSEAGNVTWVNPLPKADMYCDQAKGEDGVFVNHGSFRRYFPKTLAKVALEGSFDHGKKSGLWVQYDEAGKIVTAKYYENDLEQPMPAAVQARIKGEKTQPTVPSRRKSGTGAQTPSTEIPSRTR